MVRLYKAKDDNDKGVYKCPNVIDKDLSGYKEVERYFVSNMSGGDGGPAISPENFLDEVKKGRYYGIVGEGHFQVYIGEFTKN